MTFFAFNRHTVVAAGFAAVGVGLLAHSAAAQTTIYDNTSSKATSGFTFDTVQPITTGTSPNQTTDVVTSALADDITPITGYANNYSISSIEFVAYNNTGHNVAVRPILYVWEDNGGQPGTLLNNIVLQPVPLAGDTNTPGGNVDPVLINFSSGTLRVPTATTFWLGIQFDNNFGAASTIAGYSTATEADLHNMGLTEYESQTTAPAKTGSSGNRVFESAGAGALGSYPTPDTVHVTSSDNNFGFQVNVVGDMPEPSSLSLFGSALFPFVGVAASAWRRKGHNK